MAAEIVPDLRHLSHLRPGGSSLAIDATMRHAARMNAFPAAPLRRGLAPRRALIVLLAFEGIVALCAAIVLAFAAPAAGDLLNGAFGTQATVAALLLAGLSLVLALGCFGATGGLLRDRPGAELTALAIEATILVGAIVGLVSAAIVPELVTAAALGAIGLVLALVVIASTPR